MTLLPSYESSSQHLDETFPFISTACLSQFVSLTEIMYFSSGGAI